MHAWKGAEQGQVRPGDANFVSPLGISIRTGRGKLGQWITGPNLNRSSQGVALVVIRRSKLASIERINLSLHLWFDHGAGKRPCVDLIAINLNHGASRPTSVPGSSPEIGGWSIGDRGKRDLAGGGEKKGKAWQSQDLAPRAGPHSFCGTYHIRLLRRKEKEMNGQKSGKRGGKLHLVAPRIVIRFRSAYETSFIRVRRRPLRITRMKPLQRRKGGGASPLSRPRATCYRGFFSLTCAMRPWSLSRRHAGQT